MAQKTYKATLITPPMGGIVGLDRVLAKFDKQVVDIRGNISERGLALVSIAIRQATEKTTPVTPVDTGNLRASWFAVTNSTLVEDPLSLSGNFKNKSFNKARFPVSDFRADYMAIIAEATAKARSEKRPNIYFGYTARYAMYVHEMLGVNFKRKEIDGRQAGARWFSAAINRNMKSIVKILQDNLKKG